MAGQGCCSWFRSERAKGDEIHPHHSESATESDVFAGTDTVHIHGSVYMQVCIFTLCVTVPYRCCSVLTWLVWLQCTGKSALGQFLRVLQP